MENKIKSFEEIKNIVQELKKQNKKIVTTNGAFDLFHYGHIKNLKFAKEQGDILIVGLNNDASIRKYKSDKRPIIPEEQRAKILSYVELVDYIVIFDDKTPVKLLEIISPDIHVKGSEYKEKIIEKDIIEKSEGKIMFIERDSKDVSTSGIIEKIIEVYGEK